MEIIAIIVVCSVVAMGTGLWVDWQLCKKIRKEIGAYSIPSILLQSVSHSAFLAPSFLPLGLVGFFAPFCLGIVAAHNEKMFRFALSSFGIVFLLSLCILGILKAKNRKTEPDGTGQPM
jgi:high-affinity Fe2+/Pb2+ permease